MSVMLQDRPVRPGSVSGGTAGRRVVTRWARRLLRREWRQQILVLALSAVTVGAASFGVAAAYNAVVRDDGQPCRATCQDIFEVDPADFDLVYFDPPYAPPRDDERSYFGLSSNLDVVEDPAGWVVVVLANDMGMRAPVLKARQLIGVTAPEPTATRACLPTAYLRRR